jgi:hypothetical protein
MNSRGGLSSGIAVVEICAAVALIVSFFLPWFQASSYYASASASWMAALQASSTWTGQLEVDLITFGAIAAIIVAVIRLLQPTHGAGMAAATLAAFVAAGLGAVWLFAEWNQASRYLSSYGVQIGQGIGMWLFVAAAVGGALAAIIDLASPENRSAAASQQWAPPAGYGAPPALVGGGASPQATVLGGAGWASVAPGRVTFVESGRSSTLTVGPGQRVLVGRDAAANIRVSDPRVSRRHATIERSGTDWVVRDLGATNPTRLFNQSGTAQAINGEVRVGSGQLLMGDVLVTLFPTGA